MIHGHRWSVGCVAIGDPASEELFILAADTGIQNIKVILSPVDFRRTKPDPGSRKLPEWTDTLYPAIAEELARLPEPDR